jgi:flavin reductase (DIM6/NTAB) family NADH-FMN oxidoreductase RutF
MPSNSARHSVITADAGDGPVGLTATSVFSASAEPPMLVFSISDISSSSPTIAAASTMVVHLLDADDADLAVLCATSGIDRFADTSRWRRLPTGEPYFPGARRWLRVAPVDRLNVGQSRVLSVLALESGERDPQFRIGVSPSQAAPLVYHSRTWHRLGERSAFQP